MSSSRCSSVLDIQALDYLTDLDEGSDPVVLEYIKGRWGTVEYAQRYILRNFFRFGWVYCCCVFVDAVVPYTLSCALHIAGHVESAACPCLSLKQL